ncbi:MAG: nuclear transport factor 2 family protein [Alteromonadaceae bacterium]|nr:nuclear transport factor 2 family protein [Alteromonadaceae bacterium]
MSFILVIAIGLMSNATLAETDNLKDFAQEYFEKFNKTQAPNANKQDVEAYLDLLADDVGHSHLPWVVDDTRLPDGKGKMREGMLFYLGAHTEYRAKLLNVFTFNDSAIAIRYKKTAKGKHPQSGQDIEYSKIFMEVLELEKNQIVVIRKYHE